MPDLQRFFPYFKRDLGFHTECQIARLVRQQREAVVRKDRLNALEFRKNIEGSLVCGKLQVHHAVFIAADP